MVLNGFDEKHPMEPFGLWEGINPQFDDLVGKMTNIDPKRRITVEEALSHRLFADVL